MNFDIIVPCYNSEETVARTLESIAGQTVDNWKCIIINDGSTDNSITVIQEFLATLPEEIASKFVMHHFENGGLGEARTRGARLATSDFFTFIDADDVFVQNFVELFTAKLLSLPDPESISIITCPVDRVNEYGRRMGVLNNADVQEVTNPDRFITQSCYQGSSFMQTAGYAFKTEEYRDLFYQPPIYNEDYASMPYLVGVANKILKVNEPCYTYVKNPKGITLNKDREHQIKYCGDGIKACEMAQEAVLFLGRTGRLKDETVRAVKYQMLRCGSWFARSNPKNLALPSLHHERTTS